MNDLLDMSMIDKNFTGTPIERFSKWAATVCQSQLGEHHDETLPDMRGCIAVNIMAAIEMYPDYEKEHKEDVK